MTQNFTSIVTLLRSRLLKPPSTELTATDSWLQIQHRCAVTPPANTLRAANSSTPITSIATTFVATRTFSAKKSAGVDLAITHEPPFYNHRNGVAQFANDPV